MKDHNTKKVKIDEKEASRILDCHWTNWYSAVQCEKCKNRNPCARIDNYLDEKDVE